MVLSASKVKVALDWKAELATYGGEFDKRNIAQLGTTEPQVTEAEEKDVIEFRKRPCALEKMDRASLAIAYFVSLKATFAGSGGRSR